MLYMYNLVNVFFPQVKLLSWLSAMSLSVTMFLNVECNASFEEILVRVLSKFYCFCCKSNAQCITLTSKYMYNLQWFSVLYQLEMSDKRIEQMINNTFFHPTTDNVDRQVIFSPFGWKKKPLRFSNIDYRGTGIYTQFSLSVPTTFVWDCLKEKCEEFSSAWHDTRDCHDVTVLLIEFDFCSVTYFFFYNLHRTFL